MRIEIEIVIEFENQEKYGLGSGEFQSLSESWPAILKTRKRLIGCAEIVSSFREFRSFSERSAHDFGSRLDQFLDP